jgi:hypothetical protein
MPPRKPKQPAKRKAAPRKGEQKAKAPQMAKTPDAVNSMLDYNPQTHILCDDGKVYERKIVSGTGAAVGVNSTQRTLAHEELEKKMTAAIHQAHSEGLTDPKEIQRRILKAREDHLDGNS